MSGPHTNAAFYAAPVSEFLAASDEEAYAPLAAPAPWMHLEFDIPRLGRRVDAVLVLPECVIPIEFKVGAKKFERLDIEQAWDFRIGKSEEKLGRERFLEKIAPVPIFPERELLQALAANQPVFFRRGLVFLGSLAIGRPDAFSRSSDSRI